MSQQKRQRHNEHRQAGHQQADEQPPAERQSRRKPRQQPLEPTHYSRIAAISIGGIILIAFIYNVINDSVGGGLVMLGFFVIYGLFVAIGVKWWRQQKDLRGG